MKIIKSFFYLLVLSVSLPNIAAENNNSAFISDNLFIFMHSGAGKKYRIIGSIGAGSEVNLTGKKQNDFTQITDDKERTGWVESRYISENPSLRHVIAELNSKLAKTADKETKNQQQVKSSKQQIATLTATNKTLNNEVLSLKKALANANEKLDLQRSNVQQQWFYMGAGVLGLGLIAGLILPVFFRKKRQSSSWT